MKTLRKLEHFGYTVNNAGLPPAWCTIKASGNENIPNLTSQNIAHTYWLLKSLRIEYAYTIHTTHKKRDILLEDLTKPKERICLDPRFHHFSIDPDQILCTTELELYSISHTKTPKLFNLNLLIQEHDYNHHFTLSSNTLKNQRLLDTHYSKFLDHPIPLKLYTISSEWTGKIDYFRITPEYFTITPPPTTNLPPEKS